VAIVSITDTKRYTNVVEYTGGTMTTLDDEMRIHAHAAEFTFAIESSTEAHFKLAFEASFNSGITWYEIDTSKNITESGEYVYYYSGKTTSTIRMRLSQVTSGTPSVTPHIAVTFNG